MLSLNSLVVGFPLKPFFYFCLVLVILRMPNLLVPVPRPSENQVYLILVYFLVKILQLIIGQL